MDAVAARGNQAVVLLTVTAVTLTADTALTKLLTSVVKVEPDTDWPWVKAYSAPADTAADSCSC